MPRLRLAQDADDELESLPDRIRGAVLTTLVLLRADPWTLGKPLRGELRPLWAARVGSYRILYTIEGPEQSAVVVRRIRHRAVASRRRPETR